jgi:hypothetical protein
MSDGRFEGTALVCGGLRRVEMSREGSCFELQDGAGLCRLGWGATSNRRTLRCTPQQKPPGAPATLSTLRRRHMTAVLQPQLSHSPPRLRNLAHLHEHSGVVNIN